MASVIGLAPIWLPKPCKSDAPQETFASRKAVARLERPAARAALHSRTAFQKWSRWQKLHLRPPRSEQGRLLLTLHPENGCPTWTRTKTSGLTDRRATLTLSGNGSPSRSC